MELVPRTTTERRVIWIWSNGRRNQSGQGCLPEFAGNFLRKTFPFWLSNFNASSIRRLLLNGRGVIEHVRKVLNVDFDEQRPIVPHGRAPTRLFVGTLFGRLKVVGWSTNLQSSRGVTRERRRLLARRVAQLFLK